MIQYKNKSKTIFLGMIVRDEEQDIVRCLDSVVDYIDYWVICDTGSKDQTKEIITEYFQNKGIPGELHEDEWVDFSHNRNQYIERSAGKTDYLLLMDTDEYLQVNNGEAFKEVIEEDADSILCKYYDYPFQFSRNLLIRNNASMQFSGVLHECIAAINKGMDTIFKD